ncbi:BON domain-containing protein [Verrucomicrobium sp. GAS474]|uniref:BON domain-containing protein n=1 Tax=Verrucomicrobium sp. GAS474 TaxID=1882831 RepID=UPI00087A064F|nr:BON domain-containing protein [Verrucomicrobium sp. GAS474]SDT89786.1 BON domain-containing protein [Verrucomicrobium sp. GAS474]
MKYIFTLGALGLAATLCMADTASTNDPANSANNRNQTTTAADQSNAQSDVELTAKIRWALTKDTRLSTDAQNVKIITNQGKVTLRGVVDSAAEKKRVAHHAAKIAGKANVDNGLEVK